MEDNSIYRLADIIDFLPDATFVIDNEHNVIAWNRAMEDMTGVKSGEILGKGNYEHGIPFYGGRRPTLIDQILEPEEEMEKHYSVIIERDKEVLIVETPVLMVRGKETYLWGKASPLYDSQGTVIGAIESIRDITGRKQAEMALRNSEQRLADIINFLPDPTYVVDNQHQVIAWNRAMEEMTGVPAQEILGQGNYLHGQAIYGDKRQVMADLILAPSEKIEKGYFYAERDKGTLIMENPTANLAGKEAFLWGKATLLYDSVGNITGAIESIRDITERKKVEDELFRLKKAVEGSSNAILLTDKDGMNVNYCNEAFAALMGYSAEQINSIGGVAKIYSDPNVARDIYKTLISGNPWQGEVELRTANQSIRPASFLGDVVIDETGEITGLFGVYTDITERKQAEMALKNSEQRLADIIEFLPDATFVIDNDHKVIAWNRTMEDLSGVKAQEILGQGNYMHAQVIYGDKRPVMADLILAPNEKVEKSYFYVERDKGTLIVENPTHNLVGKEAFLWGKATLLYDSLGNITGAIESIRDITESKKVENELFRLKKAVEGSSNAILLTDKDGMYVNYCNEAFAALMGYSAEEIDSIGGVAKIYSDPNVARDIYKTLISGNPWQGEVELRTANQSIRPASFLGDVVIDETGEITGLFGVYTDITERKQAEMALKNSEQRLADIIEFLPDATFVIDNEHKVIAWNRAMEDLSGVKAQDVLGKGDYEYGIPFYGDRKPTLIDQILEPQEEMEKNYLLIIEREKEVLIVETPALTVKGKETYLWGKASLLYDSQGTRIGAIESIRDVTDRKKTEREKLEAQERAARAENLASLGLMTTGLAHAIKQPLNSLTITIDSILYWYEQGKNLDGDDLIEDLQKVLVKASRINEIIEHMRAFIRNESYAELTPINLNLSIENALDILGAQLFSHGIQVNLELGPNLPTVLAYESRMEEIIINLIANAMQSLDKTPAKPGKFITCTSKVEGNVVLEICDNGPGVSPGNMDKIFEPFFSTKEGQGMGMGLFIAKAILTTLNGTIRCDSTAQQTTFRIEIPPYRVNQGGM